MQLRVAIFRQADGMGHSRSGAVAWKSTPSDEDLAIAARRGESAALEQLLRSNFDRIHAVCRRITCDDDDANDATQEALFAIYRNIGQFDGRSAVSTWMYRVAVNAALAEIRRRTRRRRALEYGEQAMQNMDRRNTGASSITALDVRLDVDQAIAGLAPVFRAAVVLRDLCDLDYPTIAMILDIPDGTVRSRIFRARQALKATLAEQSRRA